MNGHVLLHAEIGKARDDEGMIFGEDRLMDALRPNRALENNNYLNAIIGAVRKFQGRDEFEDDV